MSTTQTPDDLPARLIAACRRDALTWADRQAIGEAIARIGGASQTAPAAVERSSLETCKTCQGNGEVVTDWERYKHPKRADVGDEAVAQCPDCDGKGIVES